MNYDFSNFKESAEETKEWLKSEVSLLRAGRANPALIENVKVDYYGAKNLLKGMASISVEDAKTLMVRPWDSDSVMPIEQAVRDCDLGAQVVSAGSVIKVILPDLTEERRNSLLKLLSEKEEEAKISLRKKREEVWRDIQDKEKDGEISEDDKYRHKDELQKIMDKSVASLEDIVSRKESEIKG